MNDFTIDYRGNSIKVQTSNGKVELNLGRLATVVDARRIEAMMNLGAQLYAEKIRQARLKVDDLINWRKS